MADQGTLTTVVPNTPQINILNVWGSSGKPIRSIFAYHLSGIRGGAGSISGTVMENGTPVQRWVRLYYRPSGELVSQVKSGSDGSYQFTDLESGVADYVVVALDDNAGEVYNALIADRITPT